MKRLAIILTLVGVMFFAALSVASANSQKEEYYVEIATYLEKIERNLLEEKYAEAKEWSVKLRACVYRCARYLAETLQYDVRIMWVINYSEKAFMAEDITKYIVMSRNTAAEVLPGSIENGHKFDISFHS